MTLEEEIEFYGFVPLFLLKNVEDKIIELFHNDPVMLEKINYNYRIFEDYILQNCFDFPDTFALERKLTGEKFTTNLQNDINEYIKLLEEIKYLQVEKTRIAYENEEMLNRISDLGKLKVQIVSIKEEMEKYDNIMSKLDKMEKILKRPGSISVNPNESTLTVLMEDDKFKKEIEKKEKEDFLAAYEMANIDNILENLKNDKL